MDSDTYNNSKIFHHLCVFWAAIISFKYFCCIFNLDLFCLGGSVASFAVVLPVEILSKCFIGNNLPLKILRTFSLALNINHKLF